MRPTGSRDARRPSPERRRGRSDGAHPRVAAVTDAEAIHAIYAPIVASTVISFELDGPTIDEMRRRISTTLKHFSWLASEDDDGLLDGYVQAFAGIALPNAASVALHEAAGVEALGVYRGVGYKLGA